MNSFEHVIGVDRTKLGLHGTPFDNRKQVALDPFAADLRPASASFHRDFVDLVDENDAGLLTSMDGFPLDRNRIDLAFTLDICEHIFGFFHCHFSSEAMRTATHR